MDRISILTGLAFGLLNFWLLSRIVAGLVQKRSMPLWKTGLLFIVKMTLLFVTIGLILQKGYVTPLPFLAGFTVSLITGILYKVFRSKDSEEVSLMTSSQGEN